MKKNNSELLSFGNDYFQASGQEIGGSVTVKNIYKDYSSKFDTLQLCFISDAHIGSSDFDMNNLLSTLEYAASQENALVFFMGDIMNTAIIGSKSDPYEDILSPQQQLDTFERLLSLAKDDKQLVRVLQTLNDTGKIVVVHSGNHEERITKAVGISPTKVAADYAGVGEAFAQFYANTTISLRQPLSPTGKFDFKIVSHHGTGIKNIDGIQRLMRTIGNADLYVIGHIHKLMMTTERTIELDAEGSPMYHDNMWVVLPSNGGGTYGAGLSLPDTVKKASTWILVSSQPNPYANLTSPTGVKYPSLVAACAFISPSLAPNTKGKEKRIKQALAASDINDEAIKSAAEAYLKSVLAGETAAREKVLAAIAEKPLVAPAGFEKWRAEHIDNQPKLKPWQPPSDFVPLDDEDEDVDDEELER